MAFYWLKSQCARKYVDQNVLLHRIIFLKKLIKKKLCKKRKRMRERDGWVPFFSKVL